MIRLAPTTSPTCSAPPRGVLCPLLLAGLGLVLVAAALSEPPGRTGSVARFPGVRAVAATAITRAASPHAISHRGPPGTPGQAPGPARRGEAGAAGDRRRQVLLLAMAPRLTPAAAIALLEDWDRVSGYGAVEAGRVTRAGEAGK